MIRIAKRYLVLVEWHWFNNKNKDLNGLGTHHLTLWKRDYESLLKQFAPEKNITVNKIPENLWSDEGWKELEAVIEVKLNKEDK